MGTGGCQRSEQPPQSVTSPAAVQTVRPTRGEITRNVTLPSFKILAYQEATLYAKVAGYLETIAVDKGSAVKKGQLLAEIEVPEMLADEAQYRAETEVARANYERMTQAREKAQDLIVPENVDDLRGQWEVARAKLERVQKLLEYARITAPFTGMITARFVDPGAFIPAATSGATPQGAALVTLADFSRLRVQVFVPEAEVPFITDGVPAQVTVEALAGRTFSGSVTRFSYALDQATKTMLTEIELPNPTLELRPGMYASVRLGVETRRDVLLLPASAVVTEKTRTSVFLLADGKARKIPIRIGVGDGANVEVLEGVTPEQPVILIGEQALDDGQAVTVRDAK
ncbi:MAG TPA: efflux RND transporter periplasmic adaptor subunit [Myxococcota bacterium]|nr:efflux RND transporter periplasmic adaptor subunit [Myxococcota bacterium]